MLGRRSPFLAMGVFASVGTCAVLWMVPPGRDDAPPVFAIPREHARWSPDAPSPDGARRELLRRARVWNDTDPSAANLAANPPDPGGTLSEPIVRCRYLSSAAHGTTAKFDCVMPDGEVVKVKYGHTGEIHTEVAATRLLAALGFGADRMYLVPHLRCYGCLRSPFYAVALLDSVRAREAVTASIPDSRYSDFEWVAVERRMEGTEVETESTEGWGWFELDAVDPASGANRAERDALRLVAVLLAHWDNKAANQRLVVRPEPFAYIHDVGATFGPNKLDLDGWREAPIWSDRATCTVSMKPLPYSGGTFHDTRISESGRRLLARQLNALSDRQIDALFDSARFGEFRTHQLAVPGQRGQSAAVNAWAQLFREKVRQIVEAGPCE